MKFVYHYHITFPDGSPSYKSGGKNRRELLLEVGNWRRGRPAGWVVNVRFDVTCGNYRITNSPWGCWFIYCKGKYCDMVCGKKNGYSYLANAVKALEQIIKLEEKNA